ncbi:2\',3\'-cyclic-nucleotide 2\'-phosphodiesterase, probable fragment [Mycoplasma suis KI3806]|uniref:2\',3\'-cyclic-nucleotide 2\'-phosphodiesterase, probable n=1 Tax=Mycoplasma suis (strain KI_3806) TaxID=708248 RepID=F0V3A3_MYCS3|nr:HD domain-containing protein [Mycoplasma suis]CBZ40325.1 2\',3\'-cyclic-nucleotide 2\'-phosphodiesterase, probable fragment [Mycoplasma suis KI3806]
MSSEKNITQEVNESSSNNGFNNKEYLSKFSKKMIHLLTKYKSPKLFTGCYNEFQLSEGKFFSDKTVGQLLGKSGERKDEFFLLTGVKPHLEYSGEDPILILSKYNVRDIKLASMLTQKFKISKSWSSSSIHKNFKEVERQITSEEEVLGRSTLENIDSEIDSPYLFQIIGRMGSEQYSNSQTLLEHSLQMAEASEQAALQLNMESKRAKKLAFYHDIGKLFLPYYEHASEKVFQYIPDIQDPEIREIIKTHHDSLLSFSSTYIALVSLINRILTQIHFIPSETKAINLKENFQSFLEEQKKEERISNFYILSSGLHFWFIFNEASNREEQSSLQEDWTNKLNNLLQEKYKEDTQLDLSSLSITFYWLPNKEDKPSLYRLKIYQEGEIFRLVSKTQ